MTAPVPPGTSMPTHDDMVLWRLKQVEDAVVRIGSEGHTRAERNGEAFGEVRLAVGTLRSDVAAIRSDVSKIQRTMYAIAMICAAAVIGAVLKVSGLGMGGSTDRRSETEPGRKAASAPVTLPDLPFAFRLPEPGVIPEELRPGRRLE